MWRELSVQKSENHPRPNNQWYRLCYDISVIAADQIKNLNGQLGLTWWKTLWLVGLGIAIGVGFALGLPVPVL